MRCLAWGLTGWLLLSVSPVTVFSADSKMLYVPKPTESGVVPAGPEEGILVEGITIRKGDTLKGLARKYRGRASYFPQILLFNKIADPDLIFAGSRLLVPVTVAHPATTGDKKKRSLLRPAKRVAEPAAPKVQAKPQPVEDASDHSLLQYERAVAAYKKGQLSKALQEFERFLADFPNSPLAADASLYRADCLLKMSRQ